MNELKPEDVMRALEKTKYGGRSCTDCKYGKKRGEDRCGLKGCRIAQTALALLREKDTLIADYIRQIADMQAQIATKDSELTALMKCKHIEADKDAEIKRLTAENEFHKAEIEEMSKDRLELHKAIARMKKYDGQWKKDLETARDEAITEFERVLLLEYSDCMDEEQISVGDLRENIKQIAKERKEAGDGSNGVR